MLGAPCRAERPNPGCSTRPLPVRLPGQEVEGPRAPRVGEGARRPVQDRAQPPRLRRARDRCGALGPRRAGRRSRAADGVEGADAVADRLHRTAQLAANRAGPASLGARQHGLRPAHGERVRRAQDRFEPGALRVARLADGRMHPGQMRPGPPRTRPRLGLHWGAPSIGGSVRRMSGLGSVGTKEDQPMLRYILRDDQWARIKGLLPGHRARRPGRGSSRSARPGRARRLPGPPLFWAPRRCAGVPARPCRRAWRRPGRVAARPGSAAARPRPRERLGTAATATHERTAARPSRGRGRPPWRPSSVGSTPAPPPSTPAPAPRAPAGAASPTRPEASPRPPPAASGTRSGRS